MSGSYLELENSHSEKAQIFWLAQQKLVRKENANLSDWMSFLDAQEKFGLGRCNCKMKFHLM